MYKRALLLPTPGTQNFFLWGPRQVGKTTLLKERYPPDEHFWLDLTDGSLYRKFTEKPEVLRKELAQHAPDKQVVIDEIQRVPELLYEVQWLIDNANFKFALCGSNQLKLRNSNLLGCRAGLFVLHGLTSAEFGSSFNLEAVLNAGYLPPTHTNPNFIDGYIGNYLYREISELAQLRQYQSFRNFLKEAALRDGSTVNYANIAQASGVTANTVRSYFALLEESLHGRWLDAYHRAPKSGESANPKFYFADVGLVNSLARRGYISEGSSDFGKAFENWVFHEIKAYLDYHSGDSRERHVSYWKRGVEVDFIVGNKTAIEVKAADRLRNHDFKGLRSLKENFPSIENRIVVCRQSYVDITSDNILVLPYEEFAKSLWNGEIISLGGLPFAQS